MKGFSFISGLLLTLLFLSSCQKEIKNPTDTINTLPKTYTENVTSSVLGNSVTTFNLTYDNNNRILSVIASATPGNKQVYTYNSNNFTMDLYNNNQLSIHEIFFINSQSLVDSTFQYNDTNDSSTEKYFYNAAKQQIGLNEYDYTKTTGGVLYNKHEYVYDNSGNQVKDTDDYSQTAFAYYSNYQNTVSVGDIYFYHPTNLIKTTTFTSGGSTVTLDHTYTFDSQNRLISEKAVASSGDIIIKSYTY
ncbi:hypothetical protein ACX0G9_04170 [Flavitalea flava]